MKACPVSRDLSQYLRDQDALEVPEAPEQGRCECGRYLRAGATMPVCRACADALAKRRAA